MSTSSLFTDYFNKSEKTDYASSEYQCSGVISENKNEVVFGNEDIELRNSNGDTVVSFDLSKIDETEISEYAINSVIVNPGEAILLKGLEYGKSYEDAYFEIPSILTAYQGWESYVNVEFDVTWFSSLVRKSVNIRTLDPSIGTTDIVSRVNDAISAVGIPNITFSLETADTGSYFRFLSSLSGYEFKITFFRIYPVWQESEYPLSPFKDSLNFDSQTYSDNLGEPLSDKLKASEDDVSLPENALSYKTAAYNAGYYGKPDKDDGSVFYRDFSSPDVSSSTGVRYSSDDSIDDTSSDLVDEYLNHFKDETFSSGMSIYNDASSSYTYCYFIDCCTNAFVSPLKYANGAARVWMVTTEYPDVSSDVSVLSMKMNHVSDTISVFSETPEGSGTYRRNILGVRASNTGMDECTTDASFYPLDESIGLSDITPSDVSASALVRPVTVVKDASASALPAYPEYYIGMHEYLSLVTQYGLWENFGDEYSVFTQEDDENTNERNLSPSIFVYNTNVFPVKVNYFLAD